MTSREVFQMGELSIQWIAVNVYYQFIDFYRGKNNRSNSVPRLMEKRITF